MPHCVVKRSSFLLAWIFTVSLATLVGSWLGNSISILLWIVSGLPRTNSTTICILGIDTPQVWVSVAINTTSIGVAVAIAQWLLLKKKYPWAAGWLRASLIGVIISVITLVGIGTLVNESPIAIARNVAYRNLFGAVLGAILGLSCGLGQGLELSKHYPRKYWWVFASLTGWMMGGALRYPILLGMVLGAVTGIAFCQIVDVPTRLDDKVDLTV
jgi:hypothetical protein